MDINWTKLDELTEAAAAADSEAIGSAMSGWGGTGPFCHRPHTDFGLAKLFAQTQDRLSVAWHSIHGHTIRPEAPEDVCQWAVLRDGHRRRYRTHRGASWAAKVNGGEAILVVNPLVRERRIARETERARALIRFALAIGALYDEIHLAYGEPIPRQAICTVRDGFLFVTGPRWWAGMPEEKIGGIPMEAVHRFLGGEGTEVFQD